MQKMLILLMQRRGGCDAIPATGPSHSMKVSQLTAALALIMALIASVLLALESPQNLSATAATATLEGRAAYGDWRSDAPGVRRQIRVGDLPAPYASFSHATFPTVVKRPADAQLKVASGFEVRLFASGLVQPRLIRVAPNGDIFVAESAAGRIRVLRPTDNGDQVSHNEIFISGLKLPFGIAFYPTGSDPQWIYVANTDSVVRSPTATATSTPIITRKSSYPPCRLAGAIGPATSRSHKMTARCLSLSDLLPTLQKAQPLSTLPPPVSG
jgi:glucose/arabinose dehydrogenase